MRNARENELKPVPKNPLHWQLNESTVFLISPGSYSYARKIL